MIGNRDQGSGIRDQYYSSKTILEVTRNNYKQKTNPRSTIPAPICFIVLIFLLIFASCSAKPVTKSEFVLGTVCTITIFENDKEEVLQSVFEKLREIDNLMSLNIPSSDICRINAAAGIEPVSVNEAVFDLVSHSFVCYFFSQGAFNPALGPVISLWNINASLDGENPRIPSPHEIRELLLLANWQDIEINHDAQTVFLKKKGMALDMGAIAKGYAADKITEILTDAGINKAIIDLGGNIVVIGEREKNRPWRVGVQDPGGKRGDYLGIIEINAKDSFMSIVTSGVYERFFEKDGIRYHHIFSPWTGYPVDNGLLSVTIITPFSMYADAYSTAVFVLGYEIGYELVNSMYDTEAVFVFKDGSVKSTNGAGLILTTN